MMAEARKKHTIWIKPRNEFLVSEVVIGEPTRCCNYARIGYGTKNLFWEGVSKALETRVTEFAGTALPSAKSCCAQFEKLLRERQDAKKNHKFRSGTTEELDEIACGLEDIMREMEEVLDENNAKDDCDTKVEADQRVQENHLRTGRVTPKSSKKKNVESSSIQPVSFFLLSDLSILLLLELNSRSL
jgi:hypothetical protein